MQVAFLHYSSREGLMPEGYYPDLLPLTSARVRFCLPLKWLCSIALQAAFMDPFSGLVC